MNQPNNPLPSELREKVRHVLVTGELPTSDVLAMDLSLDTVRKLDAIMKLFSQDCITRSKSLFDDLRKEATELTEQDPIDESCTTRDYVPVAVIDQYEHNLKQLSGGDNHERSKQTTM